MLCLLHCHYKSQGMCKMAIFHYHREPCIEKGLDTSFIHTPMLTCIIMHHNTVNIKAMSNDTHNTCSVVTESHFLKSCCKAPCQYYKSSMSVLQHPRQIRKTTQKNHICLRGETNFFLIISVLLCHSWLTNLEGILPIPHIRSL